ncbi:MAG: beta-lactamase family protein [Bacteroidales bacterium]|jgi:CubicO group peptidase (beta-lactamase class C family)|nr:beta-lactamase family protein [Bacteroidales bacterium]
MKLKNIILVFFSFFLFSCNTPEQSKDLPRSSAPEDEGVVSGGILQYLNECDKSEDEMHRFMLVKNGKVVAEATWSPFDPQDKQTIYSCSKTFTATAIGILQDRGLLSVEDKVISFFEDKLPDSVSPNLAEMSIKDLLTMTCGQESEPLNIRHSDDWVRAFLAHPVINKPGTVFKYNSMATFMLSAIAQKVTGQRLFDFLQKNLFEPLGIKNVDWEISPEGITTGGWGFRAHIEDMAKLGQLYLQKGKWNNRQIVSEEFVQQATTAYMLQDSSLSPEERAKSDWQQGYGYQIWRCRNNGYRADGAYGQFIIVLPDRDAVIAIQSNAMNSQEEINRVWKYLLPAIKREKKISKDDILYAHLRNKLSSLSIAAPASTDSASYLDVRQGDTLQVRISNDTCYFVWNNDSFVLGREKWLHGTTERHVWSILYNKKSFREFPPFKVACSYAWEGKDTLALYIKYLESPHTEKIILTFDKDGRASLVDIRRF